jgi:hypothetical protein
VHPPCIVICIQLTQDPRGWHVDHRVLVVWSVNMLVLL